MILVTGATGNVGSQVAKELRARGVSFRAFVRDRGKAVEMLGDGVDLAVGDFADKDSVRLALDGVEHVFLASANQPGQVDLENAVIDVATSAGVSHIVKVSSVNARIGSPLAFWDWHGQIEEHLAQSGVPATVLQPSFYMTGLIEMAAPIRQFGKLLAPAGEARVSMIDPADVASVAAVALTQAGHVGRTYVLTGPAAITFADVAQTLSAAIGKDIGFVDVPEEMGKQGMIAGGMPPWLADQLIILFGQLRAGEAAQITDSVHILTGREPRTFEQFARDHTSAFTG